MIQLNVRINPSDMEKAKAESERLGLSLSAYIRLLINTSEVTAKHKKSREINMKEYMREKREKT